MEEKIQTRNPLPGKKGVNISRDKYDTIRSAIYDILDEKEEMTFMGLADAVEERLRGRFEGSVGWYYTTVKLDLEARGEIVRVPGSRPQRIRLAPH
jgi:hypothetical protein